MEFPHSDIAGSKVAQHLPDAYRSYATSFIAFRNLGIRHILLISRSDPKVFWIGFFVNALFPSTAFLIILNAIEELILTCYSVFKFLSLARPRFSRENFGGLTPGEYSFGAHSLEVNPLKDSGFSFLPPPYAWAKMENPR